MRNFYDADVLVLGAGIAGLIAARELSRNRCVIVVEAQDRVGGRIHSLHVPALPLPIELGPEFIHGHVPQTFDLLKEAGLIAYDLPGEHQDIDRGTLIDSSKEWEAAEELLSRLSDVKNDCTFAEFLAQHAGDVPDRVKQKAIAYVEGFNASRQHDIGVKGLAVAQKAEASVDQTQYKLIGAYDQLPQSVARQIAGPSRIDLQTQVHAVRWKAGGVQVDAQIAGVSVTYRAAAAVIALPLGVLQRPADAPHGITFEPELSVRKIWRDHFAMGPVVRCVIRFRTAFWESMKDLKDVAMLHHAGAAFPTWWTTRPLRTALLTGWCGGAAADALPTDEAQIQAAAIDSLVKLFGRSREELLEQIEAIYLRDWRNDPHAFGAYSYARVGGADVAEQLTTPVANTLFFAGEHTDLGQIGTVAAAIGSGYRAARQLA